MDFPSDLDIKCIIISAFTGMKFAWTSGKT